MTTLQMKAQKLARGHAIGLLFIHIGACGVFLISPRPEYLAVAVGAYLMRILGITAGFHRLFTHKAYTANRPMSFSLALLGTFAGQGPLKRWVANHKMHHHHVETDLDPHSPKIRGFWYAHLGWLLDPLAFERALKAEQKIQMHPSFEWMSRHFNAIFMFQIPLLFAAGELLGYSGLAFVIYGFFVSLVFSYHVTFMVNSVCHVSGKRHAFGRDDSRNNWIVGLLALGEGWHANHHYRPSDVRHGRGWQLDFTYLFLKLCQKWGWVHFYPQLKERQAPN